MGRFFTVDDIPDATTYPYDDPIEWSWHTGSLEENFPHRHKWYEEDRIDWSRETSKIPRVEVRRWCERNLDGDVYVMNGRHSEFIYYNKKDLYGDGYQASVRWIEFCFELESDLMAFKLRWL